MPAHFYHSTKLEPTVQPHNIQGWARVVPRLRESRLLTPSGHGFTQPRDHSFVQSCILRGPQLPVLIHVDHFPVEVPISTERKTTRRLAESYLMRHSPTSSRQACRQGLHLHAYNNSKFFGFNRLKCLFNR